MFAVQLLTYMHGAWRSSFIAQNPLHTFPRNFPVDGEADNLLRTCCGETDVMDFGLITVQ